VKKLVMAAYERAFHFLSTERELLADAAHELMEHESLNEEELKKIFSRIDRRLLPSTDIQGEIHH
jgi:ATP-dependent Zn protease